jgi:hypothetical protein
MKNRYVIFVPALLAAAFTLLFLPASAQSRAVSREHSATGREPRAVTGAEVTVIMEMYTYPSSVSLEGEYVAGMLFGGSASYMWSEASGVVQVPGTGNGISETGMVGGSFSNGAVLYNGNNVETAGRWDPATQGWIFLGMNPAVPQTFSTDYNTGWDITADGTTVVGMQWYPNYDYSAFKWTQSGGYEMIGTGVGQGSRASGISADGSVVFGWAQVPSTSRSPVIWYNGQVIFIDDGQAGEAFGASTTGNYVTGTIGNSGFRWSPQGTITFSNTLVTGTITPTTVLNNGTVLGYIVTSWPPVPTARLAFVRDSLGILMTFNDYAEARGLEDAQQWIFYSINDATEDGNTLLGAGVTPQGQAVTFLIKFTPDVPVFTVNPQQISFGEITVDLQSDFHDLIISNTGTGTLQVNAVGLTGTNASRFVLQDNNTYPQLLGQGDSMEVSVAFAPLSATEHLAAVQMTTSLGNFQVPLSGTGIYGVGIAEEQEPAFRVYPVPAKNNLALTCRGGLEQIRIFNYTGQLQYSRSCSGEKNRIIVVDDFPVGLYRIHCTEADGSSHAASVIILH